MMGRLTMNPVRHFDVLGMLVFPIIFIYQSPLVLGWGKPITFTPRNFRNPSRDEMLATLAGPAAQLLAAVVALLVLIISVRAPIPAFIDSLVGVHLRLAMRRAPASAPRAFPASSAHPLPYYCILVNILLFVFNLVPSPSSTAARSSCTTSPTTPPRPTRA